MNTQQRYARFRRYAKNREQTVNLPADLQKAIDDYFAAFGGAREAELGLLDIVELAIYNEESDLSQVCAAYLFFYKETRKLLESLEVYAERKGGKSCKR